MTTFSSTIQILAVENEERTSKKTGNKYTHFAARAVLLDEKNQPINVGALRTRNTDLQAQCKPGLFRATFSLGVPDYGDDKGDIVAQLTGLMPLTAPPANKPQ